MDWSVMAFGMSETLPSNPSGNSAAVRGWSLRAARQGARLPGRKTASTA